MVVLVVGVVVLSSVVVEAVLAVVVGLGWVGLGWVGLGCVGLGWVGLGWVGWLVGDDRVLVAIVCHSHWRVTAGKRSGQWSCVDHFFQ